MGKELYRKQNVIEIVSGFNFDFQVSKLNYDRYTLIFSLIYITFYILLPKRWCSDTSMGHWGRSWGVVYHNRSLWFEWGNKRKCFSMPWDWKMVRHHVLYPDGMKVPLGEPWDRDDGRCIEIQSYKYKLKSGEVQERTAACYVEEREWRWRWFTWLPWFSIVRRVLDVQFNDEVGEETGSWKGGTIGCGYDMFPGESMTQTLKRMESEHKF